MFFKRLKELSRTATFRLLVICGGFFVLFVVLVFLQVYGKAADYLIRQVDNSLREDVEEFAQAAPEAIPRQAAIENSPEQDKIAAVFSPEGKFIAGSAKLSPGNFPLDGSVHAIRDERSYLPWANDVQVTRTIAQRLPSGNIVVMSREVEELRKLHLLMLKALRIGAFLILAMTIFGCYLVSFFSLHRLKAIRLTRSRISAGFLSERFLARNTDDDFDHLCRVANATLDELQQSMEEVKGVSDSIAHDLRAPLTHLRTRLEGALLRSTSKVQYRKAIEDALIETDLLLGTFSALLRISEIEYGRRRASFEKINLQPIVDQVGEFFQPLASEKGLNFRIEAETVSDIYGDRGLIFEAFCNLVDNAVKFTPEGGEILISLKGRASGAVFSVADSGPGIPLHFRETVFRRFVRGETTRMTQGNGLGLSLVAAIARLHSFEIFIDETAEGSLFRVNCWPKTELQGQGALNPWMSSQGYHSFATRPPTRG